MALFGARALGLLFALHAVASPAVWQRQYSPDPDAPLPSTEACVERSFSNPNWVILGTTLVTVNGSEGGTQGDIQFLAGNSATGIAAECTAQNIDLDPKGPNALAVWHNCNVTNLEFQFNLTSFDMRLRGSWFCGNSSKILFSANGTWETPLIQGCIDNFNTTRGHEIFCIMGNSQVSGSLSSPVAIAPQLPLLPYTSDDPPVRCVDRSYDPGWTVDQFSYRKHSGGAKGSYDLTLNLNNTSNGEAILCSVTIDRNNATNAKGATPWVKCSSPAKTGSLITSTEVLLDTVHKVLGVKQTWNCTDGIPGVDLINQYSGTGYLTAGITCGVIANSSTSGDSCSLAPSASGDPIRFSGYYPDAPTMPHTYYGQSCTIGSFVNTSTLTLREYEIDTTVAGNQTSLLGTFSFANPGPEDTYRLRRIPVIDDGAWHDCEAGQGQPLPWQLIKCRYSLDRKTRQIGFQIQWYCDDRDPLHAILFEATATTKLPAESCDTATGPGQRQSCRLPASVGQLAIPVSNLTWKATTGPMDRGPTLPWI